MCWRVSSPWAGVSSRDPCAPIRSLLAVVREEMREWKNKPNFWSLLSEMHPWRPQKWQTSCLWGLPELKHLSWRLHKALLLYWLHQHTISGHPFNEQTTLPITYKLIKKTYLPTVLDRWPPRKHTIQVGKKAEFKFSLHTHRLLPPPSRSLQPTTDAMLIFV